MMMISPRWAVSGEALRESPYGSLSDDSASVANSDGAAITERLIIREGNITIAVDNTLDVRDKIDDIVAELAIDGAYVVYQLGERARRQPPALYQYDHPGTGRELRQCDGPDRRDGRPCG